MLFVQWDSPAYSKEVQTYADLDALHEANRTDGQGHQHSRVLKQWAEEAKPGDNLLVVLGETTIMAANADHFTDMIRAGMVHAKATRGLQ